jgi:PIN domain nuclease of toxin-antitoxin system
MRLLLDTQAFLWSAGDTKKLSKRAREAIEDPANEILVSVAVSWEIVIKHGLGKLQLPLTPEFFVPNRIRVLGFQELDIRHDHVLAIASLPKLHADPFDRMMIAQAQVEGAAILTPDAIVRKYLK